MKFLQSIPLAAALSLSAGAASADSTALDGTPILPDPSLAHAHVLPASAATAGVAVVSGAADGPVKDCSRRNPCAMSTPAQDHVSVTAAPKTPRADTHAQPVKISGA